MDAIEYYRLAKETRAELNRLQGAVERGECAAEAVRFARFLQWSGLLGILRQAPDAGPHLTVDGALVAWEANELLQLALRVPESKRPAPYEERVLRLLEVIAGHVSQFAAPLPPSGVPSGASSVASTSGGAA